MLSVRLSPIKLLEINKEKGEWVTAGSQYKWFIDWIFYWKYYRLMIAIVICIALSAIADNHRIYGSTIRRIAVLPFMINDLINGVALGDVDGDGKIETVVIAPHAVFVYRVASGRFQKISEMGESNNQFLTSVDIADINGNGYAEIFVTSFNAERTSVNSFVLEYDGANFVKIIEGSMIYYDAPKDEPGQVENRKYFPMRLVIWQNKAKRESQVIAVKNHDLSGNKLEFRKFTKTHIEAFTWN